MKKRKIETKVTIEFRHQANYIASLEVEVKDIPQTGDFVFISAKRFEVKNIIKENDFFYYILVRYPK